MAAALTSVPVLDDDPYSDENLTDPYPLFERMRSAGPVVWLERYGVPAFTRDAECREILGDWGTFISSAGVGPANLHHEASWRPRGILESDPPVHGPMRKAMTDVISPRGVRALRGQFEVFVGDLVDGILERGLIDGIADVAEVLPIRVFGDAVGIPREGRAENLLPHGAMNFSTFGPADARYEEYFRKGAATHEWVLRNCARENLEPGGLGSQIWDLADQGEITADQAALLVRAMLSAGLDTTVIAIGNVLREFLRSPGEWDRVLERPDLAKFAIDETLRHESPFQSFFRTTNRKAEIGGVTLPKDSKLLLFVGSANRDRERWGDDADRFDVGRQAGGHLAFGMGIHQCVGQPISRLEMDVLFTELARRKVVFEPAGAPVPYLHNTLKGWSSLPMRVGVA